MKFFWLFFLSSFLTLNSANGQLDNDKRLQWWKNARFGMFIHWGPVSLKGTEIGWSRGKEVPAAEYDQLYKSFNPDKFSAEKWVKIAKDAGMKYIVLTAKHHDGFCLWDTETTDYNIMNTPFGRDVVKELAEACKKEGIVFCTYYSILDWYHPDYNNFNAQGGPGYELPIGKKASINRYNKYLNTHMDELIQNYGPLGIMWYDGEWEKPWTHEMGMNLYNYVRSLQDNIIINNRVDKGRKGMEGLTLTDKKYAGDFDTPEQEVGKFQTDRPWETCMTIAQQWAWKPNDKLKSFEECIKILVQTVGGDGNLLLNVGPMASGEIEPEQVTRLQQMGKWLEKNGESVYGTRGGPFKPENWGVSTSKEDKVYLHILNLQGDKLELPPLSEKIISCYYLHGKKVNFSQTEKGLSINMSKMDRTAADNIVVLELTR